MQKAVVIGVGRHRDERVKESSAASRDAIALAAAIRDGEADADVQRLIDADADHASVSEALAQALEGASHDDDVLITFSGHASHAGDLFLYDTNPDNLQGTALSLQSLADQWRASQARSVIVVLDSCFSGAASMRAWPGENTARSTDPVALEKLVGPGRLILTSSRVDEPAYEDPATRHGLLTDAMLTVLSENDGPSNALAAIGQISEAVTTRAAVLGRIQTPVLLGEADADVRFPALEKGAAYESAFPRRPPIVISDPVCELSAFGFPDDVTGAWSKRFETLNGLQLQAVNDYGVLGGKSLLVAAPTSSGKTFLGEMAAAKAMLEGEKVAYLAPYRAIVTEKSDEFEALYQRGLGFRICRASGEWRDHSWNIRRGRFDMAVFTYETFLSLILAEPALLDRLGLIIIDEAHFIADPSRGIVVELILTAIKRARSRGVDPQVLCLSAVVGDTNGFEDWFEASLLRTDERPVPLTEGVLSSTGAYRYRTASGEEGTTQLVSRVDGDGTRAKDFIVPIARELGGQQGEKILIFRNQRGSAAGCARYVAEGAGLRSDPQYASSLPTLGGSTRTEQLRGALSAGAAFHTSDLSREEKAVVEAAFKKMESGVQVVGATTTIAAGVNLPANTVVIAETEFLGQTKRDFTVAEYKNMAGRAGRLGQTTEGRSVLLAFSRSDSERLYRRYVCGSPEPITSSFRDRDVQSWLLKLLAQIGEIAEDEVTETFLSTFGGFLAQRSDPQWADRMRVNLPRSIEEMVSAGLINRGDDRLSMTPLGKACGAASFDVRSSLQLISILDQDGGFVDDPLKLALVIQALPAFDDVYVKQVRNGESERLTSLDMEAPGVRRFLESHARDHVDITRRAKRALIVLAWLRGDPIENIEAAMTRNGWADVRAGDVRRIADSTRFHLASAIEIAAVAAPGRDQLQEQAEMALKRFDLGLSEEMIGLADSASGLTRGEIIALHAIGVSTLELPLSPQISSILGAERLSEILDSA